MTSLQIISPTNHARFERLKPVTFTGKVDSEMVTVELQADDKYPLGSDRVKADGSWSITYSGFTNIGDRKITAIGFNSVNQPQTETSINITILPNGIKFSPVPSEDRAKGQKRVIEVTH